VGSVYFTADFLAATDQLELLCCQSDAIRTKKSAEFVTESVCCSMTHSVVVILHVQYAIGFRFESHLSLVTFLFFAILKIFPLGVTFRVRLGFRVGVNIKLWSGLPLRVSIRVRGLR